MQRKGRKREIRNENFYEKEMGALTSIADTVIPDWFIHGGGPKKDNNPE